MSDLSILCSNCGKNLDKAYKGRFRLDATTKNFSVSCVTALTSLYKLFNQTFDISLVDNNGNYRYVCIECNKLLVNGYDSLVKFFANQSEGEVFANVLRCKFVTTHSQTEGQHHDSSNTPSKSLQTPKRYDPFLHNETAGTVQSKYRYVKPRWDRLPRRKVKETPCAERLSRYARLKKTKSIFQNTVKSFIRGEVDKLKLHPLYKVKQICHSNWLPPLEEIISALKTTSPLLYKVMEGVLVRKKRPFDNGLRTILGIIMRGKSERVNTFQKMVGIILFMSNARTEVYDKLQRFGITCSYKTSVTAMEDMGNNFDKKLLDWKIENENQILNWKPPNISEHLDLLAFALDSDDDEEEKWEQFEVEIGENKFFVAISQDDKPQYKRRLIFDDSTNEKLYIGGTFMSDNINHVEQTNYYHSKVTSKVLNMTSVAFIPNRIAMPMSEFMLPQMHKHCRDVPETAFIPTPFDVQLIRNDHKSLAKQIFCKNFAIFSSIQNSEGVDFSLVHEHTEASKKKSTVINLGIIDSNQGTTDGTKEVLKFMEKYLPSPGGNITPSVANGDCLTFKMMNSATNNAFNTRDVNETYDHIFPGLGQFHLRMHLLDDVRKQFVGPASKKSSGLGTVRNLLHFCKHPDKLHDVKHNFNIADRGYRFCMISYVVAFACQYLKIDPEAAKDDNEMSREERIALLDDLAEDFVRFEWQGTFRNSRQAKYCFCETEYDESKDYISCDNNNCRHHLWYHVDCLRGQKGRVLFRKPPKNICTSVYFCTEDCKNAVRDKKLLYSKSFIFSMLMLEGYKRAVRFNDFRRMDAYNKLHLIEFYNMSHPQYLKAVYIWQARKHGWAPRNVAFDLKYNSTINMSGKVNKNIDADLFNECINRWMKDHVIKPGAHGTARSIVRNSRGFQVSNEFVDTWNERMSEFEDQHDGHHHKVYLKYDMDVVEAAKVILTQKLLTDGGARYHEGFPNFSFSALFLDDNVKFKEKLNTFCMDLDDAELYRKESVEAINRVIVEV